MELKPHDYLYNRYFKGLSFLTDPDLKEQRQRYYPRFIACYRIVTSKYSLRDAISHINQSKEIKFAPISLTGLWYFIHYNLKDICPNLYQDTIAELKKHKGGRTS